MPSADEVVETLCGVLDKEGLGRVCVAAHSYGTFYASRLVQLQPQRVHSVALIDPVTFNMFTGGCWLCAHVQGRVGVGCVPYLY